MTMERSLADITLKDLVGLVEARAPREEAPALALGYCRYCKRYFRGALECTSCQRAFAITYEFSGELERQYGEALIAVSEAGLMEGGGTPAVVEPTLFEPLDDRMIWSAPTNAMFRGNANNTLMRRAIRVLRGVLAEHGIQSDVLEKDAGEEVTITIKGEEWVGWQLANGMIKPLRRVPQLEDDLKPIPENSHERKYRVTCTVCGAEFGARKVPDWHMLEHQHGG